MKKESKNFGKKKFKKLHFYSGFEPASHAWKNI